MKANLLWLVLSVAAGCQQPSGHYVRALAGDANGGAKVLRWFATGGDPELHEEELDLDDTGRIVSTLLDPTGFDAGDHTDVMQLAARGITIASGSCHDSVTISSTAGWNVAPNDFHACPDLIVRALTDSLLIAGDDGGYYGVVIKLGFDGSLAWRAALP